MNIFQGVFQIYDQFLLLDKQLSDSFKKLQENELLFKHRIEIEKVIENYDGLNNQTFSELLSNGSLGNVSQEIEGILETSYTNQSLITVFLSAVAGVTEKAGCDLNSAIMINESIPNKRGICLCFKKKQIEQHNLLTITLYKMIGDYDDTLILNDSLSNRLNESFYNNHEQIITRKEVNHGSTDNIEISDNYLKLVNENLDQEITGGTRLSVIPIAYIQNKTNLRTREPEPAVYADFGSCLTNKQLLRVAFAINAIKDVKEIFIPGSMPEFSIVTMSKDDKILLGINYTKEGMGRVSGGIIYEIKPSDTGFSLPEICDGTKELLIKATKERTKAAGIISRAYKQFGGKKDVNVQKIEETKKTFNPYGPQTGFHRY